VSARTTIVDLRKRKAEGQKLAMVTAYDATMARLLDQAGVDVLLVGDSLGMVVQGASDTLAVTLDQVIYHCRCVAKGSSRAHLVADLPFMTYQVSPEQALENAGRMLSAGQVQSVKLEGGVAVAETVRRIVSCGIPVMGHVGLTPQSVHAMGGFRVQGRSDEDAQRVLDDALAIEAAGAWSIVLEGIPSELAERITERLTIPTIGIGAGPACDGQVLVCNDILGLDLSFSPRFVKRYARLEETVVGAVRTFVEEVRAGSFPGPEHGFASRPPAGDRAAAAAAPEAAPLRRLY
jgi:3-methyl-2-oxobutanoate hydroxymethyltransferase